MLRQKFILVLILLSLYSCKDYTLKTNVNEDGSVEKTLVVTSREMIADYNSLMFPIDNSWDIKHEKDSASGSYTLTANKKFEDVASLLDFYGKTKGLEVEVNLSKKYRWFYTYYYYEEIIKKVNPFNAIKIESYLTADEYTALTEGIISDELSKKLEKYLQASAFKELFDGIRQIAVGHNLDSALLSTNEEFLKSCIDNSSDEWQCFRQKIAEIYSVTNDSKFLSDVDSAFEKINTKMQSLLTEGSNYNFSFQLPGLIISTNAKTIGGNVAFWTFDTENIAYVDYKMFCESRIMNTWEMIATGIFSAALIIVLIGTGLRKKK